MNKKERKWTIYVHITPSNKKYVGITIRKPKKRWSAGNGYKTQTVFYRAIQKYGWDNIQHIILNQVDSLEKAKELECYYIKLYKSNDKNYGYNQTKGGDNVYIASEKTRKKMRENRQGVNAHGYGHFVSDKTKKLTSNANKNRTFSKKSKDKMALQKNKKVYQYNSEGDLISTYCSAKKASETTNINLGNICSCCRKIVRQAGGYFWSYTKETKQDVISQFNGNLKDSIFTRNEKPVNQYSLDGELLNTYKSIKEASINTGITAQQISFSCKNNRIAKGYYWRYK